VTSSTSASPSPSSSLAASTSASAKSSNPCLTAMETILVGLIALLLFLYLFAAMIRPEKF
jgi:K+-transporting ATPase KdpF subunit